MFIINYILLRRNDSLKHITAWFFLLKEAFLLSLLKKKKVILK